MKILRFLDFTYYFIQDRIDVLHNPSGLTLQICFLVTVHYLSRIVDGVVPNIVIQGPRLMQFYYLVAVIFAIQGPLIHHEKKRLGQKITSCLLIYTLV